MSRSNRNRAAPAITTISRPIATPIPLQTLPGIAPVMPFVMFWRRPSANDLQEASRCGNLPSLCNSIVTLRRRAGVRSTQGRRRMELAGVPWLAPDVIRLKYEIAMLSHAILQHIDRTRSAEIGLMRVLVATDAWHPQVNGVVRTLTSLARSAQALGVSIDFLSPDGFRTVPVPTYPGLRLALPLPRADRPPHRAGQAGCHPHRDGRTDRLHGMGLLPKAWAPVHDQLHNAISRIHLGARTHTGKLDLWGAATLPRRRGRHDGIHSIPHQRARTARVWQPRHVDAWRRHQSVQTGPRHRGRPPAADLRHGRTGCRRKEPRRIPCARPARHEGRHRQRPAGSGAETPFPECQVPQASGEWNLGRTSRSGRRLRIPEPDGHVRRRAA